MKHMKKLLALMIAVVMCMAMTLTVYASGGEGGDVEPATEPAAPQTTGSINLEGGKKGHKYELYQILKGKVKEGELIDIQWGDDAPDDLKSKYNTAAAAAKAIATQNDARAFAQSLTLSGASGDKVQQLADDGNVTFNNLPAGYYILKDTKAGTTVDLNDAFSEIVVKVVGTVTGKLKSEIPTSEKKVADNNDTSKIQPELEDLVAADWIDSADYDIGDDVPFKLSATTASNVEKYRQYHVTFQDKQSAGLASPENVYAEVLGLKLTVGEEKSTANGTKVKLEAVSADSGYTFAYKITFTQAEPKLNDEEEIISYLNEECNSTVIDLKYTSKLTGNDVVIGKPGNPNEMFIKYSNNPESKDDSEEGKTKEDKVVVFTYKTVIDKVDEKGENLTGADFALYKEVKVDLNEEQLPAGVTKGSDLTFADGVEHSKIDANKYYVLAGTKTGTSEGYTFEFKGIDDGTYVLVETSVPEGFNPYKSVIVTIAAEHSDGEDPQLTSLTATDPFTESNADAGTVNRKKEDTTHERESGEAYAEIVNNSGAELPETGGIGTTVFYIIGAILVIGAGIVLVTRRRMSAN